MDFLLTLKTGENSHFHRKALHSLHKAIVDLLGQNGGGAKVGHLLGVLHRLKGCPQRYFRLPVAHIPTDQAVHDFLTFHVFLGGFNSQKLISGFLVGKGLLKFSLPNRILSKGVASLFLPLGIESQKLLGDFPHRPLNLGLGFLPF